MGLLTTVFLGLSIHAGTTAVEHGCDLRLVVRIDDQRDSLEVIPGPECAVLFSGVHVGDFRPHLLRGNHRGVSQSQGLKDMLLQIIIEGQSGGSFQRDASPIDPNLRR